MKVLLVAVNAKYIHSNLAIYSLRAYSKKYAANIRLAEFTINHSEEDILKSIYQEKADVVAFSCYIWNIEMIAQIVTDLKKVQPKVKIWFGGPEVSYDAKECIKAHPGLEGIMIGEGEQTFLELMEHYVEGTKELKEIKGLAFKTGDLNIVVTPAREPLSLDVLPFPYEDMGAFKNKIIYYESSRGCPFSCSYCLSSIDKGVRLRNSELVKKELKLFLDDQIPQVKFVDRTFNCNKKHAMEIWRFIKEKDNGITNFHFEISADLLEEEEIEFLATLRPGQIQFEIGVQSTNPETVAAIHRKMDFNKLSSNVERIRKGDNIHQHLDLIAGLPLENIDAFERSFHDVYLLKPDQLQLGFLKVLKGSLMDEECRDYGITYHDTAPYEVLYTNHLPYEDLLRIKGICEMVEVYYNSGQFTYTISYLEHFYPSPMKLYQSIYEYYEKHGLHMMGHNRIRRYEILKDFYEDTLSKNHSEENKDLTDLFSEILLLDLCLREDLKSRPQFAPNPPVYRGLRELYEKYEMDRKSAHIEQFTFDAISSAITGQVVKRNRMILFDYSRRNPLNKAAKMIIIEIND